MKNILLLCTVLIITFSANATPPFSNAIEKIVTDAREGDGKAQLDLALLYYDGENLPQDYKKAKAWFEKASKQNIMLAQYLLGEMYYYGQGVEQDFQMRSEEHTSELQSR